MLIQIKSTKARRGLIVYDEKGAMEICANATELWELIQDLEDNTSIEKSVKGAALLRVEVGQNQIAIVEDNDEVTLCNNAGQLWEACMGLFQTSTALALPSQVDPHKPSHPLARRTAKISRRTTKRRTPEQVIEIEDDVDRTGDGEVVDGKTVYKNDSIVAGLLGAVTGSDAGAEVGMKLLRYGRKVNLRSNGGRVRRMRQPRKRSKGE